MAVMTLLTMAWGMRTYSRAWTLSTCAFVLSGACLTYATAGEATRLTRLTRPTPPETAQDIIIRNAKDEQGRRASFRILLLTDEYRWRLSSYESLDGELVEPEFTPKMKAVLNSAKAIISVGASSEEIVPGLEYAEGRAREEARAARRARRIARWVQGALSTPVPIRMLNAGHHTATRGVQETADQRRVVIIAVLEHEEGANMDEALRAAMRRESNGAPIFDVLLTRYSLAGGSAFTWVQ